VCLPASLSRMFPVVSTIKLSTKMSRALFPLVHGGSHTTNIVIVVSQDYKPHQVETRCAKAPSSSEVCKPD
jgi:hypothetical protein